MTVWKKIFIAVLPLVFVAAIGCEDVNTPPPPEPDPQITVTNWFTKSSSRTTGLQSNEVYAAVVDTDAKLWFGTSEGVSRFDGATGDAYFNQNNGLSNPKVRDLQVFNGKLWVATWGGGLSVMDLATEKWSTLRETDGLSNDLVADIDPHGGLMYCATNQGISIYNDDDAVPMEQRWTYFGRRHGLLDAFVSTVRVVDTPRGVEAWYGPRVEYGLTQADLASHGVTVNRQGTVIRYTPANSGLPEPNVNDILYDEVNDVFWLALATRGLARVDVANSTWTSFTTENGLPSNVCYSLAMRNGDLWIATQLGITRQIGDSSFRGYGRSGGLPADRVRLVYLDPNNDNRMYLGFIGAGAARVDPGTAE